MIDLFLGYGKIILTSSAVYIFIIGAIRIFGKKELSQLSIIDLVFVLLLSNAVQTAMVGSDTTLMGGLISAGSLFSVNKLFKYLFYKFPKLSAFIQGSAIILVHKGIISEKNMTKSHITKAELKSAMRQHGIYKITDIYLATLELDGEISIIHKNVI